MIKKLLILLFLCVSVTSYSQKVIQPDTVITLQFSNLPKTMFYKIFNEGSVPAASVYLPTDYSPDKTFPFILFINGATGGSGKNINSVIRKFGRSGFILANVPIMKDSVAPLLPDSSNYWTRMILNDTDAHLSWLSYEIMLDSIYSLIPNIHKKQTFMGGFSNGAHVTARSINLFGKNATNRFKNFFFVEGGNSLEKNRKLRRKHIIFFKGGKGKNWLEKSYNNALESKARARFVLMEGYGHQFPEEYQKQLLDWIKSISNETN